MDADTVSATTTHWLCDIHASLLAKKGVPLEVVLTRRKVRILTIEDRSTREGLALDPDFSPTGFRVIRTLDESAAVRG